MKDDLFFVFKMLVLTSLVVVIFQIKSGGQTIEERFDSFLKTSILVDYIQEATDGGIILGKKGYQKADAGFHVVLAKIKRKRDQPKGLNASTGVHVQGESPSDDEPKKPSRSYMFWKKWRRHTEGQQN
jgi:hypothetical protein